MLIGHENNFFRSNNYNSDYFSRLYVHSTHQHQSFNVYKEFQKAFATNFPVDRQIDPDAVTIPIGPKQSPIMRVNLIGFDATGSLKQRYKKIKYGGKLDYIICINLMLLSFSQQSKLVQFVCTSQLLRVDVLLSVQETSSRACTVQQCYDQY